MKKTAITLFALVAFASTAFAAAKDNYVYDSKFGKVDFPHKVHTKIGCTKCHEGGIKKIEINKGVAHDQLCVKCHKAEKKGPQGCKDCHKK